MSKKYARIEDALIAYKNGHISDARLGAEIRRFKNEKSSNHSIKAGANLPSQWGRVVTNEQRLIDNGHFMKTSERAKLDYMREQYRKAKKAQKSESPDIILVKRV